MVIKKIAENSGTIIERIIKNRGVVDVETFIYPISHTPLDSRLKDSIDKGIILLKKHIKSKKKILIMVDSDTDGFTSASYMFRYIKYLHKKAEIVFLFHSGKTHGFTEEMMENIKKENPCVVICPDGGTNDIEEIEELHDLGIDIIIIDHHEIDKKTDKCILINNQLEDCVNKHLTGVGMVYRFCHEFDKSINKRYAEKDLDLVMLGLIGDNSDLRNNEVRYICTTARTNIKNKLISRVLKEKKVDKKDVSFTDLSYKVIPMINAVCRVGTDEEKLFLFKALCDLDTDYREIVQKKKLNKTTRKYEMRDIEFDIYAKAYDCMNEAKKRQDKKVNAFVKTFEPNDEQGIIIGMAEDEDLKGITGLVANKIADACQKPCLILQENEEKKGTLIGSGRGYEEKLGSLKDWCSETGLFDLAQGHANAHGVEIRTENVAELIKKSEEFTSTELIYYVDHIYDGKIPKCDIDDINNNRTLFGGANCEEPTVAIINMRVPKEDIDLIGRSTLKIKHEGVYYTKFKSSSDELKDIKRGFSTHIEFNVVCQVDTSFSKGTKYYNGLISQFEYKPSKNVEIIF